MSAFVLSGGHVIDPALGIDEPRDVVVREGRIAELIPSGYRAPSDLRVEDVTGAFVTPGLVDLHGHWYEGSAWGIDPTINLRSGVTTPCDAGSTGYVTFPLFRKVIEAGPSRVLVFLHIGSLGAISMNAGELEDFRYVRVSDTVETIERNRDLIVGIKARLGTDPCGPNIMAACDAALEAAKATDLPVIFHISGGADLRQILPKMRAGDIVTHTFIADDGGLIFGGGDTILSEVRDAQDRGVVFDVGHGCGSFSWAMYHKATDQGFRLDTISTDLHRLCVEGPVFDMLTTMSKFLHAGMAIPDIVAASTSVPARAIRRSDTIGSLAVGRRADIAVFRTEEGSYDYIDAFGQKETATERFVPVLTVNGGDVIRPDDVAIRLRPYTDADREVECGAPLMSAAG